MNKIISLIFLMQIFALFMNNNAFSANVDIKVNPEQPIKNENFSLVFKVNLNGEEEPYISFDPGKAEVLGRSNQSSDQVTIINGKIARQRSMTFIYDMISSKSGSVYIKDIVVDVDGEKLKYKNFSIKILDKRSTPANLFLKAEISKTKLFVGEGFDINYYLYTRVNIMGAEIKAFPKLKGFFKRFKMVKDRGIVVEHKGVMYRKVLQYSARVFSQNSGMATIDPLQLTVQYTPSRSRRSSYGLFGSAFSNPKIKNLRSKKLKIKINELPSNNVPKSFTGLVGEHTFSFHIGRNKYLVNEAVEAKFEVEGLGALENYSAPHLYQNDDLEAFDTKSDLIDISHIKKKKVFEYTYLARAPFIIEENKVLFSYFDPISEKYIETSITAPALRISGTAIQSRTSAPTQMTNRVENEKNNISNIKAVTDIQGLVAPEFKIGSISFRNDILKIILASLSILIIFMIILIYASRKKVILSKDLLKHFEKIKKDGVSYSNLFQLLIFLPSNNEHASILDKITHSKLPKNTKNYFKNAIVTSESSSYKSKDKKKIEFNAGHFSILKKYLKEVT